MKTMDVLELKNRISSGEPLNLVDVREPAEHEEFNVGGLLLPLGMIRAGETEAIDSFKDEELVLYCRSGNRSGQAALILEGMGFTNVINVVGGMLSWQTHFPG
jgi:rhodanese-related sulfurtransferase